MARANSGKVNSATRRFIASSPFRDTGPVLLGAHFRARPLRLPRHPSPCGAGVVQASAGGTGGFAKCRVSPHHSVGYDQWSCESCSRGLLSPGRSWRRSGNGVHSRSSGHNWGLHVPGLGYTPGGWFVERGTYLTLATQVWIALPRSSSYLRGRNVGHFHTRP